MSEDRILEKFGVTAAELDARAAEYESNDWSGMEFGAIAPGRPLSYGEPLDTITVRIPHSRVVAMQQIGGKSGISRSAFIRRAIDHELAQAL